MNAKSDHSHKFKDFFTNEYQNLVNYIRKYVDTRVYGIDPDDIIQDIALNFFDKIDFNNPIENIAAYLYRAIRNKIIDYQRQPKRSIPLGNFVDNNENNYLGKHYRINLQELEPLLLSADTT